ncbi:hypothetical protein AAHH79_42165, partial [Burkholderia pseudomallei]
RVCDLVSIFAIGAGAGRDSGLMSDGVVGRGVVRLDIEVGSVVREQSKVKAILVFGSLIQM